MEVTRCREQAVVHPAVRIPLHKLTKEGTLLKEGIDPGQILEGGEDVTEEGNVVRKEQRGRITLKPLPLSDLSRLEESFLVISEGNIGLAVRGEIIPKCLEGGSKLRGGGQPEGNSGPAPSDNGVAFEGKVERKVVAERGRARGWG